MVDFIAQLSLRRQPSLAFDQIRGSNIEASFPQVSYTSGLAKREVGKVRGLRSERWFRGGDFGKGDFGV